MKPTRCPAPTSKATFAKIALPLLAALLAVLILGDVRTANADAETFVVNSTNDPGDGICDASECTLREAIEAANDNSGFTDTIEFDISGDVPHHIRLQFELPEIHDPVVIDGTTEPDLGDTPVVEVVGWDVGDAHGLFITAGDSTIRGLVIYGFNADAIRIESGGGNTIEGNFLGTDFEGINNEDNGDEGVRIVDSSDNTIGGTVGTTAGGPCTGACNLIAGNGHGIVLEGAGSTDNLIQGNFIGPDVSGTQEIQNRGSGILIANGANNNTIGGTLPGTGNLISANRSHGIELTEGANTNTILRNIIGADVTGKFPLGNHGHGILIENAHRNTFGGTSQGAGNIISGNFNEGVVLGGNSSENALQSNLIGTDVNGNPLRNHGTGIQIFDEAADNTIGGTAAGAGNVIAHNRDAAIALHDNARRISILSNSMYLNGDFGIDIFHDDVTENDHLDEDDGPNTIQNFPDLDVSLDVSGSLIVEYFVDSDPGESQYPITVQFFKADADREEGETLIGSDQFEEADFNAGAPLVLDLGPGLGVSLADAVTATATDDDGNTSEFTPPFILPTVDLPEATFIVNSVGDSADSDPTDGICDDGTGNCTLRAAIQQANATEEDNEILFDIAGGAVHFIQPTSPLPYSYYDLTIDGTSEPDFSTGSPSVFVDGSNAGFAANGFTFSGDGEIRGLWIGNFGGSGIFLNRDNNSEIEENTIGIGPGNQDVGNLGYGIFVRESSDNFIGGNVISGNDAGGINLFEWDSRNNEIVANFIGTDVHGTSGSPSTSNGGNGVTLEQARNNLLEGNVISGNEHNGVAVIGGGSAGNELIGNLIGTNFGGSDELGNGWTGVLISGGHENIIGSLDSEDCIACNVISGNGQHGVWVRWGATNNQIAANFIGTNIDGTDDIGNGTFGVLIENAPETKVDLNLISGNGDDGLHIRGRESAQTLVTGNYIGTDRFGIDDISNGDDGVQIADSPNNIIGGSITAFAHLWICDDDCNLISGNDGDGVAIRWEESFGNVVRGNFIGTDITGAEEMGNDAGVLIRADAHDNIIGGTNPGDGNLISGNTHDGVLINDNDTTGNVVQGNRIGTDSTGTEALGNEVRGVGIFHSPNNLIGGTEPGAGNVISANGHTGVEICCNEDASGNVVQGNLIGTDASGTEDMGNSLDGVNIGHAPGNLIGGESEGAGNVISGNGSIGVDIRGEEAIGNIVQGNLIGVDITGTKDIGNIEEGVRLFHGARDNIVGSTSSELGRNIISGNRRGIVIQDDDTRNNHVQGNFIGTDITGMAAIGNSIEGVVIENSFENTVGGPNPVLRNIISGNGENGLLIEGDRANRNIIQNNLIGTDATGEGDLGNGRSGIWIEDAFDNVIGGTGEHDGNVIAFNRWDGVTVPSGERNSIDPNSIFSNGRIGIDLQEDGPTENDFGDFDQGANRVQNFPELNAQINGDGDLLIDYMVDSAIGQAAYPLLIEFFIADADGEEGQTFVGSDNYSEGDFFDGFKRINLGNADDLGISSNAPIVATATDSDGNTSEFSFISESSPTIETIIGVPPGYDGDGGDALNARLSHPRRIAFDNNDNLYISDSYNHVVRKVDAVTNEITTVAGNGVRGFFRSGPFADEVVESSPPGSVRPNVLLGPPGNGTFQADDDGVNPGFVTVAFTDNKLVVGGGDDLAVYVSDFWVGEGPGSDDVDESFELLVSDDGNNFVSFGVVNPTNTEEGQNETLLFDLNATGLAEVTHVKFVNTNVNLEATAEGADLDAIEALNSVDIMQATQVSLNTPRGVDLDSAGNLYIADTFSNLVHKVDSNGVITTIAGTGECCFGGDGEQARDARFNQPSDVAVDDAGTVLHIADRHNHRVRRVDLATGVIDTFAGNGDCCFDGDGGQAENANFNQPVGLALDATGNLFIADRFNHRIRKVDTSGVITTVAGNGDESFSGDGDLAVDASLAQPMDVAFDSAGNMHIADALSNRVRRVDAGGVITTVAGNGLPGHGGEGGPAVDANFRATTGVAVDSQDNLFIAAYYNHRVEKVDAATQNVSRFAGSIPAEFAGDGGAATDAVFDTTWGLSFDSHGNLYIADNENDRIRKVDAATGVITTIAGNGTEGYCGDDGPATDACLNDPERAVVDSNGNIYIADRVNNRVRKVDANGTITTFAGTGTPGFSGDNGLAIDAELNNVAGIVFDSSGNLILADRGNLRVRKIDVSTGIITTVAGNGNSGSSGDGGPATSASFDPLKLSIDASDNIFIGDNSNPARVRRVDANTGIITTVAGGGGEGQETDGVLATDAELTDPLGLAVDANGNVFVSGKQLIRKVDAATGTINTIAGNPDLFLDGGFSGDGGAAKHAELSYPSNLLIDHSGNLLFSDSYNHVVRKVHGVAVPEGRIAAVPITSEGEASVGDQYFVAVAAPGASSIVTANPGEPLIPIDEVPEILRKMHGLGTAEGMNTTHVMLATIEDGPAGLRDVSVVVEYDGGQQNTLSTQIDVTGERSSRNFYLFPGMNFMGLGLVPDNTSVFALLNQPVPNANPDFQAVLGRPVVLADIVRSIFVYVEDPSGNLAFFSNHTNHPCATSGGACVDPTGGLTPADTLTDLAPFQGMIVITRESVELTSDGSIVQIFDHADVGGFDEPKPVPIKVNVEGSVLGGDEPPGTPVNAELRPGYNLIAPHLRQDTLFDEAFRGALIPVELAVNAITFKREVVASTPSPSEIAVEIIEETETATLGDVIEPDWTYWTFIANAVDPTSGDAIRPIITPLMPEQ